MDKPQPQLIMEKLEDDFADLQVGPEDLCKLWAKHRGTKLNREVRWSLMGKLSKRIKKLEGKNSLNPDEAKLGFELLNEVIANGTTDLKDCKFEEAGPLVTVYRHMLMRETYDMELIGEELLVKTTSWRASETCNSSEMDACRNNMYAYTWNFVRENYKTIKPEKSLNVLSQAFCWLLRQGLNSISTVSLKLNQLLSMIDTTTMNSAVQNLVMNVIEEAKEMRKIERSGSGIPSDEALVLHGVFNVGIWLLRILACAKRFDEKDIIHSAIEGLMELLQPELRTSTEILLQVFSRHLQFLLTLEQDSDHETSSIIIINQPVPNSAAELDSILQTLTTTTESTSLVGASAIIYLGYAQGLIGYLYQNLKTNRKSFNFQDVEEFQGFLLSVTTILTQLREASSSNMDTKLLEKRYEVEAQGYIVLLKLILEHLDSKKESSAILADTVESCFFKLQALVEAGLCEANAVDTAAKLLYYGGQIGTALIRMGDLEAAIGILKLAIRADQNVTDKNTNSLMMILADAYNRTNQHNSSLNLLANLIHLNRSMLQECSNASCFDSLSNISWFDWSYQWVSAKRAIYSSESKDLASKTVVECLKEEGIDKIEKDEIRELLFVEFKSYFATKSVIPDGLIGVGESLCRFGSNNRDRAIGLLSQGIGFWWGEAGQFEDAYDCLQDGLGLLINDDTVESGMAFSLLEGWSGMTQLRKNQETSVAQMDAVKADDKARNPKRYVNDDNIAPGVNRTVSAVTKLTIADEYLVVSRLTKAVDGFYEIFTTKPEEQISATVQEIGSGVIMVSMRIFAEALNFLGYHLPFVKLLIILKSLANKFEKQATNITVTAELIRTCPSMMSLLETDVQDQLAKLAVLKATNTSKRYEQYMQKISLAKAASCIQSNQHQVAVEYLTQVFENRDTAELPDLWLHVLGEAYYLMAELKVLESDLQLNFSGIPKYIRFLSPPALVSKGFKTLAVVSRRPSPIDSGWSDVFHNYSVLSTLMNTSEIAIKFHNICGKTREARLLAADLTFLAQQAGLISRTLAMVIPLAEMDIVSRSFESCETKFNCIRSIIRGHIPNCSKKSGAVPPAFLKRVGISSKELQSILAEGSDNIEIQQVVPPSHNFGMYGPPPATVNVSPSVSVPCRMPRIVYLHHALDCTCPVCSHPRIISAVVHFIYLQARVTACNGQYEDAVKVFEFGNKCHMKSILRLIHQVPDYVEQFERLTEGSCAADILSSIYLQSCVQTGVVSQLTKMEMAPSHMVKHGVSSFYQLSEGLKLMGLNYMPYQSLGLEAVAAAVFQSVFVETPTNVKKTSLRDDLEAAGNVNEIDATSFENERTPERAAPPPQRVCRAPRAKAVRTPNSAEEKHLPEVEYINGATKQKRLAGIRLDLDVGDDEQ